MSPPRVKIMNPAPQEPGDRPRPHLDGGHPDEETGAHQAENEAGENAGPCWDLVTRRWSDPI
jgi:hypothetical protein